MNKSHFIHCKDVLISCKPKKYYFNTAKNNKKFAEMLTEKKSFYFDLMTNNQVSNK